MEKEIKKIIEEKVSGVWVAEHDVFGHHYRNTKTGKLVDSVTTKQKIIDKPHLKRWMIKRAIEWLEIGDRFAKLKTDERNVYMVGAQQAHTEEALDAADAGTLCHGVIEAYIKYFLKFGEYPSDIRQLFKPGADGKAVAGARAAERLLKTKDIVPVATELLVGDDRMNMAGQLDFLCLYEGDLAILDWKLTNSVSDEYAAQVGTYKKLFERMTDLRVKKVKIFQLSKNFDGFTPYNIPGIASAYQAMQGLSRYYDWSSNQKEKISKDIKRMTI